MLNGVSSEHTCIRHNLRTERGELAPAETAICVMFERFFVLQVIWLQLKHFICSVWTLLRVCQWSRCSWKHTFVVSERCCVLLVNWLQLKPIYLQCLNTSVLCKWSDCSWHCICRAWASLCVCQWSRCSWNHYICTVWALLCFTADLAAAETSIFVMPERFCVLPMNWLQLKPLYLYCQNASVFF